MHNPPESRNPKWELFDGQASVFEQRAGLPPDYCGDIARAVLEIARIGRGDLIVEIGPGTGQIGLEFAAAVRYVGLDLSANMLLEFQRRPGGHSDNRLLIRADANASWPLVAGAAKAIFSSRALHLLPADHVASEAFRIARPAGGTLIVGRVERDPGSVRSRMAREMIERLRQRGLEGRRGEQQTPKLVESCRSRGAEILPPVRVAAWKVGTMPRQSIDSWRSLKGLAGIPVPAGTKDKILAELSDWAQEVFGGLDHQVESEEAYVLRPMRLPPYSGG